jgi:hypothetical protein
MPGTEEGPSDLLARAVPLAGTLGQAYVERRGIGVEEAHEAGVRFAVDFGARAAVIIGLVDAEDRLVSVHGRHLEHGRGENKMQTIGRGGGLINVRGGWRSEPMILVEGLFDALSLGVCGIACSATIGRWAPWLAEAASGRTLWLGFDQARSGDEEAAFFERALPGAACKRLKPPSRCKDWSTALAKRGRAEIARWVRASIARGQSTP